MTQIGRIAVKKKAIPAGIVERRRSPRMAIDLPARIHLPGVDVGYPCRVVDLSREGLFVATPGLLPLGMVVEVELVVAGGLLPLQLRASVARQSAEVEPVGLGLEYTWVSREASELIQRLLRHAEG